MTCAACERRVARAVETVPGVESARASSTHGRVEITWRSVGSDDLDADVADAVARAGYTVGRTPWVTRDRATWVTAVIAVTVVAALAVAAQLAGWSRLSSGVGDLRDGGLAVVALLGLAAGVSTCMALTGGLVLAVMAANAARISRASPEDVASTVQRLRPLLVFLAGRVVGFGVLGALLGLVGARLHIPTQALAAMMLGVALVLAVLGIRLTDLSPRIAGWTFSLPSSWGARLHLDDRAERSYSDTRTALLGAATFFLPCGFTQAAQVFALSTGSPAYAAAIMTAFALGTVPGLLVLGGLPELLPAGARTTMLRGIGVLVLLFALVNATAGLRLAGIDLTRPAVAPTATVSSNVDVAAAVQTLHMQQVTDGYVPISSVVYAGLPIRWVVDSVDPQSCAVELRAPSVGVSVTLVKGANTIDLPAQPVGTITFSCSMGMYGGTVAVVDRPSSTTSAT
jgi:sulfite exporter TauE/SafE/copper chaperone CopZ